MTRVGYVYFPNLIRLLGDSAESAQEKPLQICMPAVFLVCYTFILAQQYAIVHKQAYNLAKIVTIKKKTDFFSLQLEQ